MGIIDYLIERQRYMNTYNIQCSYFVIDDFWRVKKRQAYIPPGFRNVSLSLNMDLLKSDLNNFALPFTPGSSPTLYSNFISPISQMVSPVSPVSPIVENIPSPSSEGSFFEFDHIVGEEIENTNEQIGKKKMRIWRNKKYIK